LYSSNFAAMILLLPFEVDYPCAPRTVLIS
jgi:hypothetical protein